jgi:hypothetical protein
VLDRHDAGGRLSLLRMVVLAELAGIAALIVFPAVGDPILLARAIALRMVLFLERVEFRVA